MPAESARTRTPGSLGAGSRLLGDGDYRVLVSGRGGGLSSWRGVALNHWSGDPTLDGEGFFFYLRDTADGALWSPAARPCPPAAQSPRATFEPGLVAFSALRNGIASRLQVAVAATDAELRVLCLRNDTQRERVIEVTTFLELALVESAAFAAHPAFRKLFVQTTLADGAILVAARRPRGADEAPFFAAHALWGGGDAEWETDRVCFIGRGRSTAAPRALSDAAPLSGALGNVLDPIFALRRRVVLAAGETRRLFAVLAASDSREAALAAVRRFAGASDVDTALAAARERGRAGGAAANDAAALASYGVGATAGRAPRRLRDRFRPLAAPDGVAHRVAAGPDLEFANGYGGFSAAGDEYVIRVGDGLPPPPMPWVNVIANERFGLLVSEAGAACTWSRNSRENRLTPWLNDTVCDPHDEALYVRDERRGIYWSPLPGPCPGSGAYEVRHGFGYSTWSYECAELQQETCVFTAATAPLRFTRLRLRNTSDAQRVVSVFSFHRLVLGTTPLESGRWVVTERDERSGALLARNHSRGVYSDGVAFATALASPRPDGVWCSGDRATFVGAGGDRARPQAVCSAANLDGRCGAELDPAACLQVRLRIPAGGTATCVFVLGEAAGDDEARHLCAEFGDPARVDAELAAVREAWRRRLGALRVETPLPGLDVLANGWLLYQVLSCRLWGRTAFYQSGGAFGFRDQLQDSAALLYSDAPAMRAQILLHAAHQFAAGDVLHWWHPPGARGIRTRFSDDLLWLPYLTDFYLRSTGDVALLDERVAFVRARPLAAGEDEAFLAAERSDETADLYTHCCLAIDRSLAGGAHGLPLMGTGDWNDGMNRVGREGRGESVWLAFFLYDILGSFARWCEARGDAERVRRYDTRRAELKVALEEQGWDGDWYRRAYYDDGTPLGSAQSDECRIDALAQAWAVISGAAPRPRAARAMDAVERHLVDSEAGLIRLLTPPFDRTAHDPGYIKGYVPGIRENGGQYTHAALWVVRALAELDRRDRAAALLATLSPVHHTDSREKVAVYQVEPYVVAADVYGVAPHLGRGGWTWYTGSAAWMYRVFLESLLGLTLEDGTRLIVRPRIPDTWPGYRIGYRLADGATRYEIEVANPTGNAAAVVTVDLDGTTIAPRAGAAAIDLTTDGATHRARIVLGAA